MVPEVVGRSLAVREEGIVAEVFHALGSYDGPDVYADVLVPWLDSGAAALCEELAPLAVSGHWRRGWRLPAGLCYHPSDLR